MKKPELIILGLDGAMPSYIKDQVANGKLPNFARLLKKGVCFDDCMTVFPSITPTCWAAINTGAVPRVSGALCHQIHIEGTNPTDYSTPYSSVNIKAETFWEAAARIGKKSLVINIPGSGPAKCDGVMQVMGGNVVTPNACPSKTYCSGVPQQFFINDADALVTVDSVKIKAGGSWVGINGKSMYNDLGGGRYRFYPVYTSKYYVPEETEAHSWFIIAEEDGVRVGVDEADAENAPLLRVGDWSGVITRRFMTDSGERVPFHFRAKLEAYDLETKLFKVYVNEAINHYKEITPLSFAKEIAEIPEIHSIDYSSLISMPYITDKYFECHRYQVDWFKAVIASCIDNHSPDIVYHYFGSIDSMNHWFRSAYERVRIRYEGEHETACDALLRIYEYADEQLGWLMDNYADENTTVLVVSDHGAIGRKEEVNPWLLLEKAGLMVYHENNEHRIWTNPHIDWTKTRAYPVGSCYINVNLKGREPCGIVEESEYDQTVTEIIRALQKYGYSSDGKIPALAFAVQKEQAGFVGHGGENCGDVVYGLIGSSVGGQTGGVHSHQIPSARSKTGDIRSLCLISGPKFKEGECLARPTDLTDIAPTLCYALKYPQPKDATGGVVFQAFKED